MERRVLGDRRQPRQAHSSALSGRRSTRRFCEGVSHVLARPSPDPRPGREDHSGRGSGTALSRFFPAFGQTPRDTMVQKDPSSRASPSLSSTWRNDGNMAAQSSSWRTSSLRIEPTCARSRRCSMPPPSFTTRPTSGPYPGQGCGGAEFRGKKSHTAQSVL